MKFIYRGVHYEYLLPEVVASPAKMVSFPSTEVRVSSVSVTKNKLVYRGIECDQTNSKKWIKIPMKSPYRFFNEKILTPKKEFTASTQELVYTIKGRQVRICLNSSGEGIQNIFVTR
ncbi:MAG: hypothetical protein HC835_16150 [Oscillatoriales cyanobacterium RM2_1_1]|nr:hypothetical protein [Oscillatoriales cyanobacterium SM2_3_0]NJO47022.1 hypothetical protein [Oscillatoriales cyanobacterium RM2_1_1]